METRWLREGCRVLCEHPALRWWYISNRDNYSGSLYLLNLELVFIPSFDWWQRIQVILSPHDLFHLDLVYPSWNNHGVFIYFWVGQWAECHSNAKWPASRFLLSYHSCKPGRLPKAKPIRNDMEHHWCIILWWRCWHCRMKMHLLP